MICTFRAERWKYFVLSKTVNKVRYSRQGHASRSVNKFTVWIIHRIFSSRLLYLSRLRLVPTRGRLTSLSMKVRSSLLYCLDCTVIGLQLAARLGKSDGGLVPTLATTQCFGCPLISRAVPVTRNNFYCLMLPHKVLSQKQVAAEIMHDKQRDIWITSVLKKHLFYTASPSGAKNRLCRSDPFFCWLTFQIWFLRHLFVNKTVRTPSI